MTPTKEQLAFFDTFGFIRFPGAFADEADRIIEAFEGRLGLPRRRPQRTGPRLHTALGHPPIHRPERGT